eukprot:5510379-Karenia_brevis.AAC.1
MSYHDQAAESATNIVVVCQLKVVESCSQPTCVWVSTTATTQAHGLQRFGIQVAVIKQSKLCS